MKRRPWAWGIVGVTTILVASCRQVVGVEERVALSRCNACMRIGACEEAEATCRNDPGCAARADCLARCPPESTDCASRCANAPIYGTIEPIAAYQSCRDNACGGVCAPTCGNVPRLADDAASAECATCLGERCCDDTTACAATPDCWKIVECVRTRVSIDATIACRILRYPEGRPAFDAYDACISKNCAEACAYGNNWTCAGHVTAPAPTSETIDHTVFGFDIANNKRVNPVTYKICSDADYTCSSTPAETPADADGSFKVTLPMHGTRRGFNGYLIVSDPSGAFMPTLMRSDPPLTETGVTIAYPMIDRNAARFLALQSKITLDPKLGLAIVGSLDCVGRAGRRGLVYSLPDAIEGASIQYLRNGLSDPNAEETDDTGFAVIANLPIGPLTITMTPKRLGKPVGRVTTMIKADTLSFVIAQPTPD